MLQRFSCGAILLLVIAGIGPVTGMARGLDLSDPEDAVLAAHRTGKDVDVIPVSNDPISFPPALPYGKDGKPYVFPGEVRGEYVFRNIQAQLFYLDPLGGETGIRGQ